LDGTFIILSHGPKKLQMFLEHLNSLHESTQFAMKTEKGNHLPFLYTDIYRRPDGCLST